MIEAGADIYEKIPDGRSALDLCDDPEIRQYMMDYRDQFIRNQEKAAAAAAAAAAAKLQQKTNNRLQVGTHSLPNGSVSRTGTLYESRSSISSPYGSGSSLNRSSSVRRTSLRDREKVKKLNESFLDVLQAKDKIQEDIEENTSNTMNNNGIVTAKLITKEEHSGSTTSATGSTIREPITTTTTTTTTIKKMINAPAIELTLPPLKVPPPLPPSTISTTADTLSDVKRRREERRRGVGGPLPSTNLPPPPTITSPSIHTIDMKYENNTNTSNGNYRIAMHDPITDYSAEKYIHIQSPMKDTRGKRNCCTIF